MSCKCKNIIENFQGGTIPLDTTFLGNVDICNTGSTLSVSNIIGCSPVTIGSDSGCTSGNTTLIVSGSSVFSCDIDVLGGIYSGGTNLIDIFSSGGGGDLATVLTAGNTTGGNDITMSSGDAINSANGGGIITLDDGNVANSIAITTDNGNYLESWQYMDPTAFQLGFGQNVYLTMNSGGYDFLKTDATKKAFVAGGGSRFSFTEVTEIGGYTNSGGVIVAIDLGTSGSTSNNGSQAGLFLNSGDFSGGAISTYNSGVFRSVAVGGKGLTVKTSETAYANQISLQPSGNNFDGLLVPPTLTADRSYSFQDASGTVAFLSDITPYVTGGTYISSASTINFTNTDGGTFSVTGITSGGGSSSGIVGISDATGTYTYYSDINSAITAAVAGDVIEIFADIEETGAVTITLKAGVNLQFNGHTYTLNESTGVNVFDGSSLSSGSEVHFWNGYIKRIGSSSAGGNTTNMILYHTGSSPKIFWHDCVLECDNGSCIRVGGGTYDGGTYISTYGVTSSGIGAVNTSSAPIIQNAKIYSKSALGIRGYGGKFFNCYVYSESYIAIAVYNSGVELHNCVGYSNGSYGIYTNAAGSKAVATKGISTANDGINNGGGCDLINCVGFTTTNVGISVANGSSKITDCVGYTKGTYGFSFNNSSLIVLNSTGISEGGFGALSSCSLFNCNFMGSNQVSGHALWILGSGNKIFNCTLTVLNTSANGLYAVNATSAKYGNNVFAGNPTTPVNANITQTQTTSGDTFGNIVID